MCNVKSGGPTTDNFWQNIKPPEKWELKIATRLETYPAKPEIWYTKQTANFQSKNLDPNVHVCLFPQLNRWIGYLLRQQLSSFKVI